MSRTLISPQKGDTTLPALYYYPRRGGDVFRKSPSPPALRPQFVHTRFEVRGIFKVQFILYWKLERAFTRLAQYFVPGQCAARLSLVPCPL